MIKQDFLLVQIEELAKKLAKLLKLREATQILSPMIATKIYT